MKRKQTISIASDRRGRVPFALVSVVLLTTSIVAVSILNQRQTPQRDISPELVNERTTAAIEAMLSDTVSDAIKEAGKEPVTQAGDNNIGKALSSGDADSDEIFDRYVRLRIYVKVSQRLEQTEQRRSSPRGDVSGEASLPELSNDQSEIEAAIDKVDLTTSGESDDLQKGEYEVTIDGIEQTVTTSGEEIHREENTYTVSDETAVFEMHRQVSEYQEMLDNDLEPLLYSRQYPLFAGKAVYENLRGEPMAANAYPELIENEEQEVFVNEINYKFQQAAFGTTDQSYPSMMDTGYKCLASKVGGQLFNGVSGDLLENLPTNSRAQELITDAAPIQYPGELPCYLMMYNSMEQATTTADADLPETSEFGGVQADWQPRENHYNHIEGSAETVNEFRIDHSNVNDSIDGEEFEEQVEEETLNGEKEIQIDPIANRTFISMLDKDPDYFDDSVSEDEEEVSEEVDEAFSDAESYESGSGNGDIDTDDITKAQEAEINQLREQLIEDIDPVEVTNMQMITSENVYGELIYQIEQKEDSYIYAPVDGAIYDTEGTYGLRNAYLQQIIDSLEQAETNRQQAADDLEAAGMNTTESLVLAQASLEGEATNPDRIEELAEKATHSSDHGEVDRFEDASRVSYQYKPDREVATTDYSTDLNSSGAPKEVTQNMVFDFFGGTVDGLPDANNEIVSTKVRPSVTNSGGFRPMEISDENVTDDAYDWNIRPIDTDNNIYRITNGQKIDRPLGGSSFGRTYMKVHKINEDMNLTSEAEAYLGEEAYTVTLLRVPQDADQPENPIDDPEELAVPEIKPPSEEDFQFDVHASPGYLSSLPITREAEPTIRPADKEVRHARNTVHTPLSSKILNPLPNPGLPIIIPWPRPPFIYWIASANYWKTDIKGEYARFELQSDAIDELNAGPENYVRQDQTVRLNIGGSREPVGSVEPIGFHATGHYPMVLPGMDALKKIPGAKKHSLGKGSFGTGNNNLLEFVQGGGGGKKKGKKNDPEAMPLLPDGTELSDGTSKKSGKSSSVLPWPGWRPEHCTPGWPEVGPGVDPTQLERDCADYGPIGEVLSYQGRQSTGRALTSRLAESAILVHVSVVGGEPENNDVATEAEELCLEGDSEPCGDIVPRDRND